MTHPLHEYIAILEDQGLSKIIAHFDDKDSFIQRRYIYDIRSGPYYICDIEWQEKSKAYLISELRSDEEPTEKLLTKEKYIEEILNGLALRFKNRVRNNYLNLEEKEIKNKSNVLIKELSHLRQSVPKEYLNLNQVIGENLSSLIRFLKGYLNEPHTITYENSLHAKLKWSGRINQLATLFYDLTHETNSLNKSVLEVDNKSLTNFILNNFTDKDGKQLEYNTIYTILTHQFKKAKDRINVAFYIEDDNSQENIEETLVVAKRAKSNLDKKDESGLLPYNLPLKAEKAIRTDD